MRQIREYRFALPSLVFSVMMGLTTAIHHLHSGLVLHPESAALHAVFNEMILIPATCLSMYFFLRNDSRVALGIYYFIAILGFIFLGLYEGGWNHTVRLLAYLRIDSDATQLSQLLPADNLHFWFYEITGVLTLVVTMVASYYSWRFYQEVKYA